MTRDKMQTFYIQRGPSVLEMDNRPPVCLYCTGAILNGTPANHIKWEFWNKYFKLEPHIACFTLTSWLLESFHIKKNEIF